MDRLAVKHRLLDRGMTLLQLAGATGLTYDRLVKVVNGYRAPRADELRVIATALDLTEPTIGAVESSSGSVPNEDLGS